MIKDKIENYKKYCALHPMFKKAFKVLLKGDLTSGKNEVEGDRLYINLDEYETVVDKPFEAHRKYIDIQYLIDGTEKIGVTSKDLEIMTPYDSKKDIEFFKANNDIHYILMERGDFLILYPNDKHMPCITNGTTSRVKKAVAKVLIEG